MKSPVVDRNRSGRRSSAEARNAAHIPLPTGHGIVAVRGTVLKVGRQTDSMAYYYQTRKRYLDVSPVPVS